MQATVQYVLETELEWLFYQLWSKNTARAPTFSFQIADTVVLRQGVPQTWYFSSKEGYIFKKNHSNVRIGKITRTFNKRNGMSGATNSNSLAAASTYAYRPQRNAVSGEERLCLRIGYLSGNDLAAFLKSCAANKLEEARPNIVQCFVAPKTIKNAVIRARWTPHTLQLDKVTNKLTVFDEKHSLAARLQTFEDGEAGLMTEASALSTQGYVFERLFKAIWEITAHVKKNSDISIQAGNFFFKFNQADEPVLLFATQIKTERPIVVLNASVNMVIASQVHQQLAMSPLREDLLDTDEHLQSRTLMSSGMTSANDAKAGKSEPPSALTQQQQAANLFHPPEVKSSFTVFKEDADSISSSAVKLQSAQKPVGSLPPLRAQKSNSKSMISTATQNQCPFCLDKIDKAAARYELTVNQIVRMYEFYERTPAGLLMLPASSVKQQRFFEDVYAQVAFKICANDNKDKSVSSVNSAQQKRQAQIPRPLQNALNLTSYSRYAIDKNDPTFLFKTVKICGECYACVKAMITYQSNEQIRMATHVKNEYGANETGESLPKQAPMQGWRGSSEDGRANDIFRGENSITVESCRSSAQGDKEDVRKVGEVASMFSKVQGGKEVQSNQDLAKNPSTANMKTGTGLEMRAKAKTGSRVRSACGQRRRSESGKEESERTRLVEQQAKEVESDLKSMNKQIIKFVQRNGIPNNLEEVSARKQLKPPPRPKPEAVKARLNKVVAKPNFLGKNFQDKKQLRDARRSIRRQQAQATMDSQTLLDRHRIVVAPHHPGKPPTGVAQLAPLQLQSLLFPAAPNAYPQQASAKQIRAPQQQLSQALRGRPISAKQPVLQQAFRMEEDPLSQPQYSLQPHDVYSQDSLGRMARQASANEFGAQATSSQAELTLTDNPHVYSKYDMARVYLNPIYKRGELTRQGRISRQPPKMASSYIVTQLNKSSYPRVRLNSAKPRPYANPHGSRQPPKAVMPAALQIQHPAAYGGRPPQLNLEVDCEGRNVRQSLEGEVQRASLDMFNYQSNGSTHQVVAQQATMQAHSLPHANHVSSESQPNLEQQRHEKSPLAASLLGLQEISEDEIDEIAANADNLIQILKDIKQRKGLSSQQSDQAQPATEQQQPDADFWQENRDRREEQQLGQKPENMPTHIHSQGATVEEVGEKVEEVGEKVEDFWNTQKDWHCEELPDASMSQNQNADLWEDNEECKDQQQHSSRQSNESVPGSSEKAPSNLPEPGEFANFQRVRGSRQAPLASQTDADKRTRSNHGSMDFSQQPAIHSSIETVVGKRMATSRASGDALAGNEMQHNAGSQVTFERENVTQRASMDGTSQDTGAYTQQTKQCDMERSFKERRERIDDLPVIKSEPRSAGIEEQIPEEVGYGDPEPLVGGIAGSADSIPEDLMGRIDELVQQRVAEQLTRQQAKMPNLAVFAVGQDNLAASKAESSIQDEYMSEAFQTQGRGGEITESILVSQTSAIAPAKSPAPKQLTTPGYTESRAPSEADIASIKDQSANRLQGVQGFEEGCGDGQLGRSKTLQACGLEQNIQEQTDQSAKPFEETAQFNPSQSRMADETSEAGTRPLKSQDFAGEFIHHPREELQTQGAATQAMQSIEANIVHLANQSSAQATDFQEIRGSIQRSIDATKSEKPTEYSLPAESSQSRRSADVQDVCESNLKDTRALDQAEEAQSMNGPGNDPTEPSAEPKPDLFAILPPESVDGENPKAKSFVDEPGLDQTVAEQQQPSMDTMSGILSPSEPQALKQPTSTAFNIQSLQQQEPLSEYPESAFSQEKTEWKNVQPSLIGSTEEVKHAQETLGAPKGVEPMHDASGEPLNKRSKCSTQVIKATGNEMKRSAGQTESFGQQAPSAQADQDQPSKANPGLNSHFSAEFQSSQGFPVQPEEALKPAQVSSNGGQHKEQTNGRSSQAQGEFHAVQVVLEQSAQYSQDAFSEEGEKAFTSLSVHSQAMGEKAARRKEIVPKQETSSAAKNRYAESRSQDHVESDYSV